MFGSGISYLWVALGGALGSVARFGVTNFISRSVGAGLPWGTLLVNVSGSLIIGAIAGLISLEGRFLDAPDARAFVMIGVLGGFTTFSSFSLESLNLARDGEWMLAGANIALSVVLCLAAVGIGYAGGAAFGR